MQESSTGKLPVGRGLLTVLSEVEEYVIGSCQVPLKLLVSAVQSASSLKIRMVQNARMMKKVPLLRTGFMRNFPFCVRKNDDSTYTVFDGNHRFHAILWMIAQEWDDCLWTMETEIPCIAYKSSLSTELAMKYAALTNELQLCAEGATPLDTLRLILNLSRDKLAAGCEANGVTVWNTLTSMFESRGSQLPNELTYRVIQRVAMFLFFLVGPPPKVSQVGARLNYGTGKNALLEAERLSEHDAVALHDLLFSVTSLYRFTLPTDFIHHKPSEDGGVKSVAFDKTLRNSCVPECFLPQVWNFDVVTKRFSPQVVAAKYPQVPRFCVATMFVRMLWAHWVLHGGIPAKKKECLWYADELEKGLDQWAAFISDNELLEGKATGEDEDTPAAFDLEAYLGKQDADVQPRLIEAFGVEDVFLESWPEKAAQVAKDLNLQAADVSAFGLAMWRTSALDMPDHKLVKISLRPALEVAYKDVLVISHMRDLLVSVPRWQELVKGVSVVVAEDDTKTAVRAKNAEALLDLLQALHLLTQPATGGGSTSLYYQLSDLKAAVLNGWHSHFHDQEQKFQRRSRVPCYSPSG